MNKVLPIHAETFLNPKYTNIELRGIVKAIICSQLALFANEQVKYTKYYKQTLKKSLNSSIKELLKAEKSGFDTFIDSDIEEQATVVHDVLFTLIEQIGNDLDFPDYGNVIKIIDAYKNSPKSIMGLVKKINR
jgi:hypothetical protein